MTVVTPSLENTRFSLFLNYTVLRPPGVGPGRWLSYEISAAGIGIAAAVVVAATAAAVAAPAAVAAAAPNDDQQNDDPAAVAAAKAVIAHTGTS